MIYRLILFLVVNFGALALGSFFTGDGVPSDWYTGLAKAPWTPPGWVFGFAWTTIMVCFSIYLAFLWPKAENKRAVIFLFVIQWLLNVAWNPVFFFFHYVILALIVISLLTVFVGIFILKYWSALRLKSVLLLPYFIWLLIATSLNGYILWAN